MISEVVARVARRVVSDYQTARPAHWGDFVLAEGLIDVAETSGDAAYLDCARGIIESYMEKGPDWGDVLWQWAGLALPALRLQSVTGAKRYGEFGVAIIDRLRNRTKRTKDNGITPQRERPQLWIDALHFTCPSFSEAALLTGDQKFFDLAIEQIRVYVAHLLDAATGLLYHVWDEETDEHSPCLWSRGNGWLTIACVETLSRLPGSHPDRRYVVDVLTRQLEGIARYQDPCGHWHTIIDRPDSYIETSAAAIFGFSILKGVRLGILDRSWLGPACRGWMALQDKVSHDGLVFDVSTGTPPGDFDHYQSIKKGVETYGTGLFLQLGVEMSKL